jgi:sugar transferase (PEP-CTERM system associated)
MMSTSNILATHTPTGTIERITVRSNSSSVGGEPEEAIRVWPYWTTRPTVPHFAVAVFLTLNIVTAAAWAGTALPTGESVTQTLWLAFGLFASLALCYLVGLDKLLVDSNTRLFSIRTLGSLGTFFALVTLFPRLYPRLSVSGSLLKAAVLSLLLFFPMRFLLRCLMRREGILQEHLIVGTGQHAQKLYADLVDKIRGPVAPVSSPPLGRSKPAIVPGSTIDCRNLRELAIESGITTIVIAEPDFQNRAGVAEALLDCKLRGLKVENAIDCYERYIRKIWLAGIRPAWLICTAGFKPSRLYLALKRILDVICATALAISAAPILVAAAIAIKLDSPGPVLFRQSRVGLNGTVFSIWKFRTMYCDAERSSGPVWAADRDSRISPVGRILRSYRLDEIPQVLNVLNGEMSFIGPRPERPNFVELLREKIDYYALRHCVKPGITGWAQVMHPYGASIEDSYEKLEYDLYYLKHMSLVVDLRILLKTVPVVLGGRGR